MNIKEIQKNGSIYYEVYDEDNLIAEFKDLYYARLMSVAEKMSNVLYLVEDHLIDLVRDNRDRYSYEEILLKHINDIKENRSAKLEGE